jgi:TP901 family phage tail tape measure protein
LSDVNANIGINFDTKQALANLRQLQAGLSRFNQSLTQGNVAAANAQKGLNAQLMQSINATGKFVASQKEIRTSTRSFTDALEKNQLSMREYARYTAAAATANTKTFTRMFAAEREIINRARKDRVKSLQSQYVQLTNAQGDFVKVLQVVPKHLQTVNGKYADYATRVQMAAQRQQLLNQLLKQGSTQLLNFGKNTQWAGRQLMVGLTVPLSMLGSYAAKTFREMEEATVKFTRVYGDMFTSGDATNKAIADIQRLGKEFTKYGVAAKDTMEMAASAAAMGLTGSALNAQVSAATKLSVLGQVEQQQALETTISLQNAFGISSEDLAKKINFLNAVENQTVLSIEDLTIAIPKAGPVVKQLGGNVEDLAFFMTAMKEGGINASEGANALKSGLASLINPSAKASAFLADLGINVKGIVNNNAGDLKNTVIGFAQALDTLDPLNRARAIEQMFGKFQFARLSTLFQNVSKDTSQAARALGLAGASVEELAILSERELGKVENAVGVKFQKTIEQLKIQLLPVGKAFLEALTPVVAFFGKVLEKFNGFSEGSKKAIAIVVAVLAGLAPVALMTFGVVANGAANLIKFFAMLRGGIAKLNGQNQVLGGGFDYLTQQEIENLAQTQALHTSHQQLISTFNVEKAAVDALALSYGNAGSQALALASSAPGLFNSVPGPRGAVGGIKKFAEGVLSVPGTGNKDTVAAMLTPGESVIPAKQSEKHRALIQAIITDKIPGYSDGLVGGSTPKFIQKERERIQSFDNSQLIAYAKRVGLDIADTSETALENIRKIISSEFEQILQDVKTQFGKITQEGLTAVGKKFDPEKQSSRMGAYHPAFDQLQRPEFSHVGQTKATNATSGDSLNLIPQARNQVELIKKWYGDQGRDMPELKVADAHAMMLKGKLNNAMSTRGKSASYESENGAGSLGRDFQADFEKTGAEKWRAMTTMMGGDFDKLKSQAETYDRLLIEKLSKWNADNAAKPVPEIFDDSIFKQIESQITADMQTLAPEFSKIVDQAKQSITAIRVSLGDDFEEVNAMLRANGAGDLGPRASSAKIMNHEARPDDPRLLGTMSEGAALGDAAVKGVRSKAGTDSASPSKKARSAGQEVGDGLIEGMKSKEGQVQAQSSRLGDAAVPSAAETQAKMEKMDLGNKAFYDDINTPEMRGERQVLKSLDRRRRKLGAKGAVAIPQDQSQETESLNLTINASKSIAENTQIAADATGENVRLTEETTSVLTDVRDGAISSADAISGNSGNLITQERINSGIAGTEHQRSISAQETALAAERLANAKEQEANAAVINAQEEAARFNASGSQTGDLLDGPLPGEEGFIGPLNKSDQRRADRKSRKLETQEKRGRRREAVGRVSGKVSGGLGTAAMVAGMAGAPPVVTAALGGAATIAQFAPMLAGLGPLGIAAGAVAGAAGGLYLLDKAAAKAAKAQTEFANKTQMTSKTLQSIGAVTGKVGASEIMDRRRREAKSDRYTTNYDRKGQQFGTTFLESDVGKSMADGFAENIKVVGEGPASQQFAANLALAVSDGVMTAVEASDVARQMAIKFGDTTLQPRVDAELNRLIGPYGEDLIKDPLQVRLNLIDDQSQITKMTTDQLTSAVSSDNNSMNSKIAGVMDSNNPGGWLTQKILSGSATGKGYNFAEAFGQTKAEKVASFGAASGANAMGAAQAQLDAYNLQAEKKIQELQAQRAITTEKSKQAEIDAQIKTAQEEQATGAQAIRDKIAETLDDQLAMFAVAKQRAAVEGAFFDSLKESVKLKYKGTAMEAFTDDMLSKSADLKSKELEVTVNTIVASGQVNPLVMTDLLDAFTGDEDALKGVLDVAVKTHGADKIALLINNLGGIKKPELKKKLTVAISKLPTKQMDAINNTLTQLQTMDQKDFDINVWLGDDAVKAQEKLLALQKQLEGIENVPDPLTKAIQLENVGIDENAMKGITANWEYFMSLPETVRKTAIQTYVSAYTTVTDDAVKSFIAKKIQATGGAGTVADYWNSAAGRAAAVNELAMGATKPQYSATPPGPKGAGLDKGGKDGNGSNPLDFLDSLAMRIKNVRQGAFDATKPLASMMAAFTSKKAQSDASKMFDIFDGLQQRMLKLGVPKEFRDMIAGMSAEDFTAFSSLPKGKNMFTYNETDANGKKLPKTKQNIKGITKEGRAVMQTYNEAQAGEYQLIQQETLQTIKDQNVAFSQLISTGMSTSDALKVVENSAIAAAIASGSVGAKGSAEFQKFTDDIKLANSELEKQAVINTALGKVEESQYQEKAIGFAKAFYDAGLSIEQIDEVLSDPQMAAMLVEDLKDGKIEAGAIKDYLDTIPKRIEISVEQKLAKKDFLGAAAPGFEIVDKMFQIQESLIRHAGKATTKPIQDQIEAQEILIRALQTEEKTRASLKGILDDYTVSYEQLLDRAKEYQDTISKEQRDLEVNSEYGSRVIEKLTEDINDLNREIEMNPDWGARAIDALQKESSELAHDLDLMNKATEKINEKYDKQAEALEKVRTINENILEQQKQQLDLADAITSGDISAAARAAQAMRETDASQYADGVSSALEQSRDNAIKGLRNSKGQSQKEIEERQFEIAQKIYAMENDPERVAKVQKIKDLQDAIYAKEELRETKLLAIRKIEDEMYAIQQEIAKDEGLLDKENKKLTDLNTKLSDAEKSIQKQVDNIRIMGKDKDGWDLAKTKLEAYNLAIDKTVNTHMAALTKATAAVEADWESINDWLNSWLGSDGSSITLETIHKITYVYSGGPGPGGDTGGDTGGDAYVAPEDDEESLAEAAAFDAAVERLDAAQAALDAGTGGGQGADAAYDRLLAELAAAQAAYDAIVNAGNSGTGGSGGGGNFMQFAARGGLINPMRFASGGYARGTDTVPAMLTPGEFVMSKYAVSSYGVNGMKAINSGQSLGDSVYNYSVNVNVASDADPDEIARAVMKQIKQVDSQRIKGNRL